MYQVFVVEDELLIRQNIRNMIEKMQGPFTCCGEASDGEMAISLMQELMPDILITDIRMPFLDGFGLIRHAKAMMPWVRIVIISGYGDFEFAQKAITLGVDQYMLKPVRAAELNKVLNEIAVEIENSRAQKLSPAGFEHNIVNLALKKHFIQQLLYGGTNTQVLLEQAQTLNLNIVRSHYLVAVCFFDTSGPDYGIIHNVVDRLLSANENLLFYFNAADQLTLLIFDNEAEMLNEQAYQSITILRHELSELCPVITAVVSEPVSRLALISESHKNVVKMLKSIGTVAAGQTINAGDTARLTADMVRFTGPFDESISRKLQCASSQDVSALLDEILSGANQEQFGSMLVRCDALVFFMKVAVHIITDNTPGQDEQEVAQSLSEKYNVFEASQNYDTFRITAQKLLEEALQTKKNKYAELKYNHVIHQAEEYVMENYCDPNITLIQVAGHVGMSPAHFSTVFSQKRNRTFINYLTFLRIEKAKKLLVSTNLKLSEIALEVGYNEPNYFSHVFRKMEGITPKEFRNKESEKT